MSKRNILIVIAIALIVAFFQIISKPKYPRIFPKIVAEYKSNTQLMDDIGGYRTYEYYYKKSELKGDTLNFKIKLIWSKSNLLCTGLAIKNNRGEWQVLSQVERIGEEF